MSGLVDRITAVQLAHDSGTATSCSGCGAPTDTRELHATHVAEQIAEALREDGIVGFIRNDAHIKPRVYTDADAEAWADGSAVEGIGEAP